MRKALTVLIMALPLSGPAQAQDSDQWKDWTLGTPFTIALDVYFPVIDTRVRIDASDGSIGTLIDFEQNLGMSDTETLPAASVAWRFAKKHRLVLGFYDLSRSGSAITTNEIRFGDEVFQVDLPISSFFDTQVTALGYSYSLVFDEKKELALTAGLSVQNIKLGLVGNSTLGVIKEESGLTAPFPTFGLSGGYAFTDKWIGRAGVGVFAFTLGLDEGDELSGEVVNANVSIQHNTFENVHFALTYSFFDVGIEFEDSSRINSVDYQYHGPALTVEFAF